MTKRKRKTPEPVTDYAWGIERDRTSNLRGRLVVGTTNNPILMWKQPGKPNKDNLGGAILHGQEVTVTLPPKTYKGAKFYWCECVVTHDGQEYPQAGYITQSLLRDLGKEFKR